MILPFMKMPNILSLAIMWKYLKFSNFMPSVKRSFIHYFGLEIYLYSESMFVLLLELSVI